MNARAEALRKRYLADKVETASPIQRLLMLFDALLTSLHLARTGFENNDLKTISDHLIRAQHILFALEDPLDPATPLGKSLRDVYGFCLGRLLEANMTKNAGLLEEVIPLIQQIAEANRQA